MNRRELLGTSVGAVLASAIPLPAFATTYNNTSLKEFVVNETTATLHESIIKGLSHVVSENSVHAISPAEWDIVSGHVIALGNVYGQLGNHHFADNFVRVNQNRLRNKWGYAPVQIILDKGLHFHMHATAEQFQRVAEKMRDPEVHFELRVCELALAGVSFDYLAIAFALDPITAPAAPALGFIGLGLGIASLFLC